jgi:hypothetical protein
MIKYLLICLLFPFYTSAQAPANDECTGAVMLNVNNNTSSAINYNSVLGYATQSMAACISSSYPAKDAWYKFVATSTVHNITLKPIGSDDYVFEVFKGSCNALQSIACVNNTALEEAEAVVLKDLNPSETYYIRVYNYYGDATPNRSFNLCINTSTTTVVNDECSGAIEVPIDFTAKSYANTDATVSMPLCKGIAQRDIWFKFVATGTRHQIYSEPNYGTDPVIMEVFTGDCDHLVSMKCFDAPNHLLDLPNLVPGTTYYYRVALGNNSSLQTNIYTRVTEAAPPPDNDECTGAVLLPVNNNNSSQLSYNSSLQYATESLPGCSSTTYAANDTWYKFVATAAEHNITLNPTSTNDFIFEVFKGNCGQLVSLACINQTGFEEKEATVVRNLQIGDTYYIRVYNRIGDASPTRTFNLCVNTSTSVIPNDDCTGAIDIPITERNAGHQYTNLGATLSAPACYGTADNDIWFKFTATQTRHRIYAGANEGNSPIVIQVYQGDCSNLTSILCYNGPTRLADLNNLIPGNVYHYRIYMADGNSLRTNIYTEVSAPALPPGNDECTGAVALPVNNNTSTALSYNSSLEFATQSMAACINTGYEANDTWYKFVATATTHNIVLTPTNSGDFVLQVFKGDCNGLSSIACKNESGLEEKEAALVDNLTPGNTYYIRVYNRYGDATPTRTFNLMINSTTSVIPNDECSGAINIPIGEQNNQISYSNIGATLSMPACSGVADNDIWFKFTATSTRHQISAYASSGDQPVFIQLFKGYCASLVPVLCYDYSNGLADISNLTPGETYSYRIYFSNGDKLRTDFRTAVKAPLPKPPTPVLSAGNTQCAADTLKVYVTAIDAGNSIRAYVNGYRMNYDKLLWWYPNTAGTNTIKAIQVTPENNISDTAVLQITTVPLVSLTSTVNAPEKVCASSGFTVTVTPGVNTPSQTTVRLFEENTLLDTQLYTGSSLTWNIPSVNTQKRYYADMIPPADVSCVQVLNSNTVIVMADEPLITPRIILLDNMLKIDNYQASADISWQFRSDNTWLDIEGEHRDVLEAVNMGSYRVIIRKGECEAVSNEITLTTPVQIKFYPVPTEEFIYIGPLNETAQWALLEIMGLDGRKYISENIEGKSLIQIRVGQLPKGMYIVQLHSKTGNRMQKKIIKL